jgi:hypothetical protein
MGGRLVSGGLSLSALSLAGGGRRLPCGDDCRKYVVHLDRGSAIHCIESRQIMCWDDLSICLTQSITRERSTAAGHSACTLSSPVSSIEAYNDS